MQGKLFIQRLKGDWDRAPSGMKKAWSYKDAFNLHACCGGFLAIMNSLKREIPQSDYLTAEAQIKEQFNLSILDPDITHFLETTVPPVSLNNVNFVRTVGGLVRLAVWGSVLQKYV